jgi:hypothetical protein
MAVSGGEMGQRLFRQDWNCPPDGTAGRPIDTQALCAAFDRIHGARPCLPVARVFLWTGIGREMHALDASLGDADARGGGRHA